MKPDLNIVYKILTNWAKNKGPRYYTDLSEDYEKITGRWFEPHGSWAAPLGEINIRLSEIGAPAISALVFLKEKDEPGAKFWGCAKNVPKRPKDDTERLVVVFKIVKQVEGYDWPNELP